MKAKGGLDLVNKKDRIRNKIEPPEPVGEYCTSGSPIFGIA